MGGSEISSVGNSNGENLPLPVCGCNAVMKLWLSNTDENPKRKFWKCRYSNTNVRSCKLFIWDDELDKFFLPKTAILRRRLTMVPRRRLTMGVR